MAVAVGVLQVCVCARPGVTSARSAVAAGLMFQMADIPS